jgi:hypothetical protein
MKWVERGKQTLISFKRTRIHQVDNLIEKIEHINEPIDLKEQDNH